MKRKLILWIVIIIILIGGILLGIYFTQNKGATSSNTKKEKEIEVIVLDIDKDFIKVQDEKEHTYSFKIKDQNIKVGMTISLKYQGTLNTKKEEQNIKILSYKIIKEKVSIPDEYMDDGIFKEYYEKAFEKLETLSLDEKIGQLFLVRYPDENQIEILQNYHLGGYLFFAKDFKDLASIDVQNRSNNLQENSSIPLLMAVDEEGGNVVRISSNPNLAPSRFKSSKELYSEGGLDLIKQDTIDKSEILSNLGMNLNLAPVVDVSTNPNDYMYNRALGQDASKTAAFAKTVIEASKNTKVSYTLKHFPGYGNNQDTHTGSATDSRSYEDIMNNDILPFQEGINAQAEAVLVSHNIVTSIDQDNPASLSPAIHNLLRDNLHFTGIIMTDDIAMGAVSEIEDVSLKALLAGNDLIITTDYEGSINTIKKAIENHTLDEKAIDKAVFKILAFKYYKGLLT